MRKSFFYIAGKIVVSTPLSLLHTAMDLIHEINCNNEIKTSLAFVAQKVVEVVALEKEYL
jgi:5-methyltetrahydropteroyltriglutamate--homocysteine methyltransferase